MQARQVPKEALALNADNAVRHACLGRPAPSCLPQQARLFFLCTLQVSSLVADMCVPGFDAGGSAKDCEELGGLLAGYAAFREASAAHGVKLALRTAPDTLLELPSTEDMQHVRQRLGAQQHPHPAPH